MANFLKQLEPLYIVNQVKLNMEAKKASLHIKN